MNDAESATFFTAFAIALCFLALLLGLHLRDAPEPPRLCAGASWGANCSTNSSARGAL